MKADDPDRDTLLSPIRSAYERDLATYFLAQRGALSPLFKAEPEDVIEAAIRILTAKRFRDRLRRISQGPIEQALAAGATGAARTLGIGVSFSIPASEAALERVTAHLERLGKGIENTTVGDVRGVLERSLREGVTNAETRRRLDELFDGYGDWRLDRISRTETTAAYGLGAAGQYRDAGIQSGKTVDGDMDSICIPWNGRLVTLDEYEAEPIGHPNCTRVFIPDTSGLRAAEPEVTKAEPVPIRIELVQQPPSEIVVRPEITVSPTPIAVDVSGFTEVVADLATRFDRIPAPVVPVVHTDVAPFVDAVTRLDAGIAEVRKDIRRTRKRRLEHDDLGRVTGSIETIEE